MEVFSDVRFKQRAVIEILNTEKVPPIEIHRRMKAVYGDQCVDVSTVRRWVRRFKDGELGQAGLSNKIRSGRPVTASDQLHQGSAEELIRRDFLGPFFTDWASGCYVRCGCNGSLAY